MARLRTSEILREAVLDYRKLHQVWPRSLEQIDPFGMSRFAGSINVFFQPADDGSLKVKYTHKNRGKGIITIECPDTSITNEG